MRMLSWCLDSCLHAGPVSHHTYSDPLSTWKKRPSSPSPVHCQYFPMSSLCWDHRALYTQISSVSNLSTGSAAGPGDAAMAGVMGDTGWEHMPRGLTEAHIRGRGHWCQVVLPLPPAALPSPSCWCQCSWNYAVGQMRNLIQLKANMTLKQKNV